MKWIEINVCVNVYQAMYDALIRLVDPLASEFKAMARDGCTWHYLWENQPWPLTLRVRFYCDDDVIEKVARRFEELHSSLAASQPPLLCGFCYGRHGECGKEYSGEADEYGPKGWELVSRMLNFGSEVALELIKAEGDGLMGGGDFKKPLEVYVDRYVHLFLDQMAARIDELRFCLDQFIARFIYVHAHELPSGELVKLVGRIEGEVMDLVKRRADEARAASGRV